MALDLCLGPSLAMALLVAGCGSIPNVGTDVAMTGMPNTEIALRDSMRLVEAEMGKLGSMAPPTPAPLPVRADAYPVAPVALNSVAAPSQPLPPPRAAAYPVAPVTVSSVAAPPQPLPPSRAAAYPVAPVTLSSVAAPPQPLPPLRADADPVVPGELQKVVVFTWTGNLEDGVRQLAGNIGYVATVVLPGPGQASIPVSIATGPVPVIQAFQVLGDAAGDHAVVRVDPTRRQVDVLYHA